MLTAPGHRGVSRSPVLLLHRRRRAVLRLLLLHRRRRAVLRLLLLHQRRRAVLRRLLLLLHPRLLAVPSPTAQGRRSMSGSPAPSPIGAPSSPLC